MSLPLLTDTKCGPVGVIVAIDEERAGFAAMFAESTRRDIAGRTFRIGRLNGIDVVVVRAGIGKVNAALAATLLCQSFDCRALALSGVAGGLAPGLQLGDVVLADRLICHDYGAQVDGEFVTYQPGTPPMPGFRKAPGYVVDATLLDRLQSTLADLILPPLPARAESVVAPRLMVGTILTGDTLVNCATLRASLHARFGGLVVEMEGAAVSQVARRFGVPAIVVRSVSDLAGHCSKEDFTAHLSGASRTAAMVINHLITAI